MFLQNSEKPKQKVFDFLKKTFTTASLLVHFNFNLETWIKSDIFTYMLAAILL